MKLDELNEATAKPRNKAGVIPFIRHDDGSIQMMFMSPSDPSYGGPEPQIAKGGLDAGENAKEAAIREGEEELGLQQSNVVAIYALPVVTLTGFDATYTMAVYAVEVKDQSSFGKPHYETGKIYWLTPEEFAARGRKTQKSLVAQAATIAKVATPT